MARTASTQPPPAPATPGRSRAAHAARRRIDQEHHGLNELLRSLAHSHDLGRIASLLAELETLLVAHFAGEEGDEGMHQIVSEGASHRLPNLQRLFDEHRELLARLAELRAESARLLDGPVRQLRDGVATLSESLHRHEQEENALFGEAFYSELGRS